MQHFKKSIFALLALAVVTQTGCSADGDEGQDFYSYPEDNVVRLTACVGSDWTTDLQPRAAYTSDNITEFGISINNTKNERFCYGNEKVTKSGAAWTSGTRMLWEKTDREVNIYAYAPYNANYTGNIYQCTNYAGSVSTDQTEGTDHSDFLSYKISSFKPGEDLVNGCVPIELQHMLSQLNVTLRFGASFNTSSALTKNPVTEVTVGGTIPGYTFNFATQTVTCSTGSAVTIKVPQTSFTVTDYARAVYSCIVVPQTVAVGKLSIEVTLNVGDEVGYYTYTNDKEITLESGKSHALELTIE